MLRLYDIKMKVFMLSIGLLMGLMSLAFIAVLWNSYADLRHSTAQDLKLSQDMSLLKDVRFHVVQIQQFLTDVGATRERGGLDEARENLQQAKIVLAQLARRLPQAAGQIARIKAEVQATHDAGALMALDYIKGGVDAGNVRMRDLDSHSDKLTHELDALTRTASAALADGKTGLMSALDRDRNVGIGFALGYALLLGLMLYLFFLKVVPPLRELRAALREMNSGDTDLARRLPVRGKDLISGLSIELNTFMQTLQKLTQQISSSATQVEAQAEGMKVSTGTASSSMDSQMRDIEMVATAINEMSTTVQEVAQNASVAADAVREADSKATEGSGIVTETVSIIDTLAKDVQHSSTVIQTLETECGNVGSVLQVIREIAEQTNLLALNAAIEAARAGEQGRGFAVVADEVRTLATRTQDSTREIQEIIERLQAGSHDAVKAMDESCDKADTGVSYIQKAGNALDAIRETIAGVMDMNVQIASAVEEQSCVSEEISQNVERINSEARTTTADVQTIAQQSGVLAGVSTELQGAISHFKL